MTRSLLPLVLAIALAWSGDAVAQVAGSGSLTGNGALKVKGCGTDELRGIPITFTVQTDGTWVAVLPDATLGGTTTLAGKDGRKLQLQFAPVSTATFLQARAADISQLCARSVTMNSVEQKAFTLTLNKKRTRAKVVLSYRLEGTAGGKGGNARYKITAKGPWTTAS